jgi:putative ABC transport system permease protein
LIDALLQDLRYALRMLLRAPGFSAAAMLSLALGIGANTAIFSIVNAVFLRRLPVAAPERLVRLYTSDTRNPGLNPTSLPNFRNYRDESRQVFSELAAYDWAPLNLASGGEPEMLFGQVVTANYFATLGVTPILGRGFRPAEEESAEPVAILSHGLWTRRFAGEPGIVGRTIELNGLAFTVVGVAPREFTGLDTGVRPELWVPLGMHARAIPNDAEVFDDRRTLEFSVFGRLRDGASVEQASAIVRAIGARLARTYPKENESRAGDLLPLTAAALDPEFRGIARTAGGMLMTIVGLVLLIACANVANLLLSRATARRREFAVRLSLGASRGRLVSQLLTESALLSVLAGAMGLALGNWAYALLLRIPEMPVPLELSRGLDGRILGFTLAVSIAAGLLFGLAPALQATRPDTTSDLKDRGDSDAGGRAGRLRSALVISQIALSLVALVGASLFVRSLQNAQRIDPGFDADRLAALSFNLGAQGYSPAQAEAFHRALLERAAAIPGVTSASLSTHLPLFGGGFGRTVFPEGTDGSSAGTFAMTNVVGTRYFATMGIPLLKGRDLEETDRAGAPRVAVVNEAMAKRFWPQGDAIGRRFHFFGTETYEVVGIARDSKVWTIGEDPRPCAYLSFAQNEAQSVVLQVRAERPDAALAPLRRVVRELDPRLPVYGASTLRRRIELSLWAPRMAAGLLGSFGALALTIATVGLYGVMAFSVVRRTREIGLRVVMRRGLRLAMVGVVAGVVCGGVLGRLISSLLYSVTPWDAPTFTAVPLTLLAAALLATYLPARRATRVDPMAALRYE